MPESPERSKIIVMNFKDRRVAVLREQCSTYQVGYLYRPPRAVYTFTSSSACGTDRAGASGYPCVCAIRFQIIERRPCRGNCHPVELPFLLAEC